IRDAERFGFECPLDRWRKVRAEIHEEVCTHGYDAARNCFVQSYGSKYLDASLLQLPVLGFLPPDDPRILGTIAAIERELRRDIFVRRYHTASSVDGLPGSEGSFRACSFWLVDAYALCGRRREAEALFDGLVALGNDLGLFSEEYDSTHRRMLGNFPQ